MLFKDRFDAAEQLAKKLHAYRDNSNVVIMAIPRGGLQLGSVLARELHAPLDVVFVKKLGYPGNPEYAIGAVGLNYETIDEHNMSDVIKSGLLGISEEFKNYLQDEAARLRELLKKRYKEYKGSTPPQGLRNKIVIVVDDGAATGRTFIAALNIIKQEHPAKLIAALPVLARETLPRIKKIADDVVYLSAPADFFGIGQFYQDFRQVEDEEAIKLLHEANEQIGKKIS